MKLKQLNQNPVAFKLIRLSVGNRVHEQLLSKAMIKLEAEAGVNYRIVYADSLQQPANLSLKKKGNSLIVKVGKKQVLELLDFYSDSWLSEQLPVYQADENTQTELFTTDSQIIPCSPAFNDLTWQLSNSRSEWLLNYDGAAGSTSQSTNFYSSILAKMWPQGFGPNDSLAAELDTTPIVGDLIITGSVAAGPVYDGVSLEAYDQNGNLLGNTVIQSDGTYTINSLSRGDYRGVVLLKVVDTNTTNANYIDEATAANKSLNAELRALGIAEVGQTLFGVIGPDAHLIINITPLTELAVRQAGVSSNAAVSVTAAQTANNNVASAFGLSGVELTGNVTTTNSASFDPTNGLSNAEKYGIALTKLSGLDSLNAGNMATSLDLLAANLNGSTLTTAGATLVDQGRAQALTNLKTSAAPTFNSAVGGSDTVLNRQLLGDIVVTAQDLDSNGCLVVSGTALPGVTLTVTLPDGSTQQTVVDATGHFSLTSLSPQPSLDTPVKVVGTDALSAPVNNAAPNVPVIDIGNGNVITGSADPATTVTVKDMAGNVIGTAVADALGFWSLTPEKPLISGTNLKATAVDAAGNASGPGAGVTDPNAVVIVIPEASDGYVDAAEKASDGGVPIDVSLPANAVAGDVIKSLITLPNGSTLTLTHVLSSADITAGQITQLMGPAELPIDGLYQVSSTLINSLGNSSAPSLRSFLLDTAIPDAPVIAPSNGQIITGTAEPGTTVTVRDGAGNIIGTVGPVGSGGYWTLLPLVPLADNATITATATDPAGYTSGPGVGVVDTGALLITGAIDNQGPRTGLLSDGAYTNDTTPQLTGSLGAPLAAGETLAIYREGVFVGNAIVNGNSWSFQDGTTAPLVDGPYAYEAKVQNGSAVIQSSGVFHLIVDNAPSTPGVQIPDAANGVSNAEALDGVALRITLPQDAAVGDVVTTVITLPNNGGSITRTTVLTQAMITVGIIVETVTNAELGGPVAGNYLDGTWNTSTTLTDAAGNVSAPQPDSFRLAANAPSLIIDTIAGDNIVNAAEKAGDLPVSGSTSAELGQAVTITLVDSSNNVIGTYFTTVKADGTFALNIPQADLPADGSYSVKGDVSNSAGTPAVQQTQGLLFDTVAPVIAIDHVAGDAVGSAGDGLFDGVERGFDPNTYQLSNTVTTLPVISGTTDAEVGQTVTVLLNNVVYTTTVQSGGTWSITLTQNDAKALVHGNSYDIRVNVSDVAGNPAVPDTNNHLVVNIAPPDVPTIDQQYAGTTTPLITGTAQKLAVGNPIALADGDIISFTLNGVTVNATIDSSQPNGTNCAGVSYDPVTKAWSLDTATAANFALQDDHTYDVAVGVTAAGLPIRNDISTGELILDTTPPTITLNPISPDASGVSVINAQEQNQPLVLTGTTDAQVGSTVTLTGLDGVTRTAIVQAGVNGGANTFSIPVPGSVISGLADGTLHPSVSVTNLFGLTGSDSETLLIDTTAPSTPAVVLPESTSGVNAAEAISAGGTPLEITLPQDTAAGDVVTTVVTKADGTVLVLNHLLTTADITAGTITQLIAASELTVDGHWTTSTTITDPVGNSSAPQAGGFLLDTQAPGAPSVVLPEASNGVNAAEAASNGGTPLDISLPGDAAVGDVVTTIVTLPDNTTLTLNTVLTVADVAAGTITQLIPTSALIVDGAWTTSTTLTDMAGNTGPARAGGFVLDTTPPSAPAAVLATSSDTGVLADSITKDTTPSISGTGTAGDTITVTFPTGEVLTAIVAADGTWTVTPTQPLSEGLNTVVVTATDPAGNTSPETQLPLRIDTTAPLAPAAVDLAPASDTGVSNSDKLTNDNTPTLVGTGTPGDTITVYDSQRNPIATAIVDANGNWSATTTPLAEGLNNLTITATDPAGNEGPAAPLAITIDTAAPAAPLADVAAVSDTGISNSDNITKDNTPTISGTAVAGDTITVTFPGGEVQTVIVPSNGIWNVTPTNPLPDGLQNVIVTATDPAGNTSAPTTVPVTIDTTAPSAPLADVAATSDTGSSNTDNITSDNTPTISGGNANPGDTITVTMPGTNQVLTTVVAADGSWSVTPTQALADGTANVTVTATDPAGNISAPTTVPVTIDTTAPVAPTVNSLITNDSTPVLTGTAILAVGETLQVFINGATYNVTVAVGGNWSLDTGTATPVSGTFSAFVANINYPVTATVIDLAGNATSDATTNEVLFDNMAPSTPTVDALVTNDSTPVITGTANLLAGETLKVTVNGASYNVAVANNGTWSLDTGSAIPVSGSLGAFVNGTRYPVTATITDLANNQTSDITTNELLFDTTAPSIPAGDVAASSDTGVSNTDNITRDTTPEIIGTGTPGDTMRLYAADGTTLLGTAVVDAAGNWSITPSNALPEGPSALQVTATDPAGNTSAPATVNVTIDTSAPAAPTALLDPSSDTGVQGDSTTNDNTPTLSGTGTVGDTITIKDPNGNVIASAVVDVNGNWNATPVNPLPQGVNNLSVTATDPAGNTSAPAALPITIDTTASAAPVAALAAASDSGIAGDSITNDNTPTITGTGVVGDTIKLYAPNGTTLLGSVVVAANGTWSITPIAAQPDGLNNFKVNATDPAGNVSAFTTVPVTIDTVAPNAPAADVAALSDTGSSNTDNITSDNTPTISGGSATPGDTITVTMPGSNEVLTAVVAADGTWSVTPTQPLADGTANVSVTATDPQGNVSTATLVPVTIDTTAPIPPVATLDATSNSGLTSDNITNDNTPLLSGTGVAGDTITVMDVKGRVLGTALVTGNGTWSFQTTVVQPNGLVEFSITATDPAGNTSLPAMLPVMIDTVVATPVIDPTNGVGQITGTGEAGATVTLTDTTTNTVIGTAIVAADGTWSITPSSTLLNGDALSATQTDVAGNLSQPTTSTVDNNVPNINATNGILITGTGKPGDSIALTLTDGTPIRDASGAPLLVLVDVNGNWTATSGTPLADGTVVKAIDTTNHLFDTQVVDAQAPTTPIADVAATSDSGISNTDNITSDTTPTIVGNGTAGDVIKLYAPDGTTLLGSAVVATDGSWAITPTNALPQGLNNLQVTATDPVGNTSAPGTMPVTIDTTAPTAPVADVAAASDTGVSNTDNITNDTTPTISGTGTAGDTITVTMPGTNEVLTAVVAANGTWSVTPTQALADGTANVSVTATDPAGNVSTATLVPVTIDTSAPAAPAADVAAASDTGVSNTDNITSDTTPTISGTGTAGDTITVTMPGTNEVLTVVVALNGTWSVTPTQALADGTANVSVTATDTAGNVSPATLVPVTIDTTAPAAPAADMAAASDTGVSNTDNITSDNTPTISGTGTAGDTITVTMPGTGEVLTAVVAANGSWSVTPTQALADGTANVSVIATDPAGNVSPATLVPVTIDTTPPAAPVVTALTTNDTTPTISGTATLAAGESLQVTVNGATYNVTVANNGTWSLDTGSATPVSGTLGAFVNGQSYSVTATTTDLAGNTTSDVSSSELTIDTTPPATPVVTPVITADLTPTITGTATLAAGESLQVTVNGATYNVTVGSNGSWALDTGTATPVSGTLGVFANGQSYSVTATTTDLAGNTTSDTSTGELTIDTSLPASPVGDVAASSDSGISNTDNITNDNTPEIVGTGTPGNTIKLYAADGTTLLGTAIVDQNGNWSITPTTSLPDGLNNLVMTATDPQNRVSAPSIVPVTIDTSAPSALVADVAAASDTGVSNTDNITSDNTPTISGTGTAGDTITVTMPATNEVLTAVVAANGTWSVTPTQALADGTANVSVTATDPAGNVSTATLVPVTIDTSAPAAPAADVAAASDTGVSNTDNITSDTTPTISGTGTAGDTITVTMPGTNEVLTVVVALNGTWSVTPTQALADGTANVSVTATDSAGNVSAPTSVPVTIDTTAGSISVAIPEAANRVSSVEAADGVQMSITVPAAAKVGDVITTVVTAPNGSTSTLTYTLLATDLPSAQGGTATGNGPFTITQTVPQTTLQGGGASYLDGTWTTSSTLTDAAGNTGSAVVDGFTLAANTPVITIANVAGDNIINAAEKAGAVAVSGTTTYVEVGQTVTVKMMSGSGVLHTYTATVQAGGTYTLNIPSADIPVDGSYSLTADVTNAVGVAATQVTHALTVDATAPVISVTSIASDTVSGSQNGTFDALERGPLNSNTVARPLVISGTTDAEVGQTVTFTLNGQTYTTSVQNGGSWAYTLSDADAIALKHGSSYAITAMVSDLAGNSAADTNNSLVVNIAAPDIPTVVEKFTGSLTPTIIGHAQKDAGNSSFIDLDAGDILTVTVNNVTYTLIIGSTSSPSGLTYSVGGQWSLAIPTGNITALGDYDVSVSATAGGVTKTDITSTELHITAATPTITLNTISGGTLNAAESTQTLPITGTTDAPVGATVTVTINSVNYTALVQVDGSFTVNVPGTAVAAIANGTQTVSASVTNQYGLTGNNSTSLIVDKTAPAAPVGDVAAASDTGVSNTDNVTSLVRPAIVGTAEPNAVVKLYAADGTTLLGTVTADGSGNWSITPSANLNQGLNNLTVTATDAAGNTSAPATVPVTVDTTLPAAPTVDALTTGNIHPTITGTALLAAGETLQVTVNGATYNVTVGSNGTWSLNTATATPASGTLGIFSNGSYAVTATTTDLAGNTRSDATTSELTINTNLPVLTGGLAPASDSGLVGDNITNNTTPTFSGLGTPGSTIKLYAANGTTVIGTTVVLSDGTWAVKPSATLAAGVQNLSITSTNAAGTIIGPMAVPVTIDTAATITIVSVAGDAVTTTVAPAAPLNGTFSIGERGFDSTTYTLNNTVTTTPVISGTTDAESGSTVTLTLNGKTYTTTVVTGSAGVNTWTYTLSDADAKLLNHGNTYAITASVTDITANTGTDNNNGVVVNIAPPDVPTVVSQYNITTLIPTITGVANKIDNLSNTIHLQTGDALTVVLKNATGTALATYALTVGAGNVTTGTGGTGLSVNTELSYDKTTGIWTLGGGDGIPAGVFTRAGVYNVDVTSTIANGGGSLSRSDVSSSEISILPTPPTINATAWATTGVGNSSSLTGVQEALYDRNSTTFSATAGTVDNRLYYSEASSPTGSTGTVVRVQLPNGTGSVPVGAGDVMTLSWDGVTTSTVTLSANDVANKYVDVTVPYSLISAQSFGDLTVSAKLTVANTSLSANSATLNSIYFFDLPLANTGGVPGDNFGYRINGRPSDNIGAKGTATPPGMVMVGDVNGDGYDDMVIGAGQSTYSASAAAFVVFGSSAPQNVDLSAIALGGSTQGFMIAGLTSANSISLILDHGDFNGDGLDDISISSSSGGGFDSYIVYGKSGNTATVQVSSLTTTANSNGLKVTAGYGGLNNLGDLNGDGIDDWGSSTSAIATWRQFEVKYGSADATAMTVNAATYDFLLTSGDYLYNDFAQGADVNGDGYGDLILRATSSQDPNMPTRAEIYFGSATGLSATNMYSITGLAGFQGKMIGTGDINGDGRADMVMSTSGSVVYVNFGKSTTATYNMTELSTGTSSNGFMILGNTTGTAAVFDQAKVVGDFNGDGLDDIVIGQTAMTLNGAVSGGGYLIYGKTSFGTVNLTDLKVSEGFRIDGVLGADKALTGISGGGDINGDGFADLIVSSPNAISSSAGGAGQASGTTAGGVSYIIYGGPSILNPMVFQSSNGDLIGTGAAETLTGTAGNNQIVAGQGNDTVIGAGGADVLLGGQGNDVFVLNTDNVRNLSIRVGNDTQKIAHIDGGNGLDTIQFAESMVVSLQSARTLVENVERFDLAGTGGTLQIESGLDVNLLTDFNQCSTANGWTLSGTVTGFDGSVSYQQVVVDGTSSDKLRLGADFVKETGSVTYAGSATSAGVYDVYTNATTRSQVLVKQGVQVLPTMLVVPTLTLPEADLISSFGFLSLPEAQDAGSLNNTTSVAGTPVLVSLTGTGANAGDTVRVNWESQAAVPYTLTAADVANGYARVSVPTSVLVAATAAGTKDTVGLTAQVFDGTGVAISAVGVTSAVVDFSVTPTTPPLNAPIIAALGSATTSAMTGLSEVVNTNVIYRSAALDGVQVNVVLKTAAAAGDWIKITWGDQEYTYKFTAAVAINTPTTITVPYAVVNAQGMGTFNVSVQQFKADGVSGTAISAASTVTGVKYAFDMLPNEANYGFVLQGEANYNYAGYAVSNAGDVNGDGYDDLIVGAPGGASYAGRSYVVFGASKMASPIALSSLTVVGNTLGFVITGTAVNEYSGFTVTGGGDVNGDGLADLVVANAANYAVGSGWYPQELGSAGTSSATYVVFGKTSTTAVNLTALTAATNLTASASSLGFKINTTGTTSAGWSVSNAGDVNGDGLDDVVVANPTYGARDGRAYVIYGKASGAAVEVSNLPAIGANNSNGFMITADTNIDTSATPALSSVSSGDINGDGYSDLVLGAWYTGAAAATGGSVFVLYGKATNNSIDVSALTAAANGRGFRIIGEGYAGMDVAGVSDVNGDGLADVLLQSTQGLVGTSTNKGAAWVVFGKTNNDPVNVSSIEAGVGGFAINLGLDTTNNGAYAVSSAGDFNGDGLGDIIVTHPNASYVNNGVTAASSGAAYIVFGKTGTGTVQITSLDGSEGFRIVNPYASEFMGNAVSGGGDINGDGFDDVIIGDYKGDTTLTDNGKTYVVYGGVSNTQATVFQVSNGDQIGTSGADTLTGTSGNNQLVGGLGNDTLIGAGGADVLYGGMGNDTIVVNADNIAKLSLAGDTQAVERIDGGGGIDTLKLDGADLMLDLANIKSVAMQNMEKIDLTGSGNNTLKLNVHDLLENFTSANVWNAGNSSSGNLAATVYRNQLMVTGDAGDKVVLSDLTSWAQTLPANFITINGHAYDGYNLGAAQLLIEHGITVSAS